LRSARATTEEASPKISSPLQASHLCANTDRRRERRQRTEIDISSTSAPHGLKLLICLLKAGVLTIIEQIDILNFGRTLWFRPRATRMAREEKDAHEHISRVSGCEPAQ
jgi:hypothetical protein